MQLRPYQQRLIDETRDRLRQYRAVLLQAPTGAGKTAITVHMMYRAAELGKRSMFVVHQNELLRQTSSALWKQKLEHGMIASGKRLSKLPAQVASAQTLVRRLGDYKPPDLIIIDECMSAGTIIETSEGPKRIENIRAGDMAMCYNNGQIDYCEVTDKWMTQDREIYEIKAGSQSSIKCTGNHRLYTKRGWVRADELTKEDHLFFANADASILFTKINGDFKEGILSGIKQRKEQLRSGIKFIKKQLVKYLYASADAVKKQRLREAQALIHLSTQKDQGDTQDLSLGTIVEEQAGIIKSQKQKGRPFLELFLVILRFFMPIKNQQLQGFHQIMGRNKKNGLFIKLKYYQILSHQYLLLKIRDMALFQSEQQQLALRRLMIYTIYALLMARKMLLGNGLTASVKLVLRGGYVMTALAQEEGQPCIRKDSHKKNKRSFVHGYQKNMEELQSYLAEKDIKKYQFLLTLKEKFFRLLSRTFRSRCSTRWIPISSVLLLEKREPVYDITVPSTGNFFANGALVHNCHRSAASTYQRIIEAYPSAKIIGLTATPARTDGKGLGDTFQSIVSGPSIRQLIDAGYLCDYEIFAPPSAIDMSGVKTSMGEYDKTETELRIDRPSITGDAVRHYQQHAAGKRMVVMCVSLKHGDHVVEQYRAAGIPAAMIDGRMTDAERERILEDFAAGRLLVLVNVQLMIEGVDIPAIEAIQWLRPTHSLIIWMQGNGRGLRPHAGKERLLIFDHVGNWHKHGLPDDDREWTLEGRTVKERKKDEDETELTIQQCKSCYHIFRAGPSECPSCGAPVERKTGRQIEQQDGELEKIDLERERMVRKREQASTRTLRDLIALGMRRGLNRPAEWAVHTIAARQRGKPTGKDFDEARTIYRQLRQEASA